MHKNFISLFYVFTILYSYSCLADGTHLIYECNSSIAAYSCNSGCASGKNASRSFKINIQKNTILEQLFIDGSLVNNSPLKNCEVVDEKNWICKNSLTFPNGRKVAITESMNNDIFSNSWIYSDNNKDMKSECAKRTK
jgi:hypothetical protein